MATFFAYLRVSTIDQVDQYSFDVQSRMAKQLRDSDFPELEYSEVRDAESGRSERPNLDRIIGRIRKGDVLFVYDNTRLSRNEELATRVKLGARKIGFRYFEGTKEFNFDNPTDSLLFSVQSAVSQFDSSRKAIRVREGMLEQKEQGLFILGPTYGYRNNHGIIEVVEEEAEMVRRMFSLYLQVRSIAKVANILNSEGFRGKKQAIRCKHTNVIQMLKNPIFIGKQFKGNAKESKKAGVVVVDSMLLKNKLYPPIVDEEMWWAVQNCYHKSAPVHREPLKVRHSKYPYSSLFICKKCLDKGTIASYWRVSSVGSSKVPAYGANNHITGCRTRPRNIREDRFVWIMDSAIQLALKRKDVIDEFVRRQKQAPTADDPRALSIKQDLGRLEASIQNQEQKFLRYSGADEVLDLIAKELGILKAKKRELEAKLYETTKKEEVSRLARLSAVFRYQTLNAGDVFEGTPEQRRGAIRQLISSGLVYEDRLIIKYEFGLTQIVTIPRNRGPLLPTLYPILEFDQRKSHMTKAYCLDWEQRWVLSDQQSDEDYYYELLRDGANVSYHPVSTDGKNYFPLLGNTSLDSTYSTAPPPTKFVEYPEPPPIDIDNELHRVGQLKEK